MGRGGGGDEKTVAGSTQTEVKGRDGGGSIVFERQTTIRCLCLRLFLINSKQVTGLQHRRGRVGTGQGRPTPIPLTSYPLSFYCLFFFKYPCLSSKYPSSKPRRPIWMFRTVYQARRNKPIFESHWVCSEIFFKPKES